MINRVVFKVQGTFDDKVWADRNLDIESLDKAFEIADELEEMNPSLRYRIIMVIEEVVTDAR